VRALSVVPGKPDTVSVQDQPDPSADEGSVLVQGLLVGVCGTDIEIINEGYGWPPPGQDRLVLGHESLGQVIDAPAGSGFTAGDLIAGIVRRPDPLPCEPCGMGQWDFCRNGNYTERGIKERNGYAATQWRVEPEFAMKLDAKLGDVGVLMEPTTVVSKAWEQSELIASRVPFERKIALVTGAGPIGLLAALLGVQRGYEVHVLDRVDSGPKPALVRELGATFHAGDVSDIGVRPDIVIECTGYGPLVFELTGVAANDAVICLAGISGASREVAARLDRINKQMVLDNIVLFGSVNAAKRHYEQAAAALAKADFDWLGRLVTRKVPLSSFADALVRRDDDVKVAIDLRK
ncbi:MAG: glucose 1-dehydrogenase, partial [Actinomycetota bacterium]|nr:glucose 1-dehydrogenase [Actinomycetota bacterium]